MICEEINALLEGSTYRNLAAVDGTAQPLVFKVQIDSIDLKQGFCRHSRSSYNYISRGHIAVVRSDRRIENNALFTMRRRNMFALPLRYFQNNQNAPSVCEKMPIREISALETIVPEM